MGCWEWMLFAIATTRVSLGKVGVGGGVFGQTKTESTHQHAEAGQIADDGCDVFGLCFNGCPHCCVEMLHNKTVEILRILSRILYDGALTTPFKQIMEM